MSALAVLFAITDSDVESFSKAQQSAEADEAVMSVVEDIEERWDEQWLEQNDKAWDAIHRCLTDGRLEFEGGEYPLGLCILGGVQLGDGDDYIVSLKSAAEVADIAAAIESIGQADFRTRYFAIDAEDYDGEIGDEDYNYTWEYFQGVKEFYVKAANAGRAVIFTVDQ